MEVSLSYEAFHAIASGGGGARLAAPRFASRPSLGCTGVLTTMYKIQKLAAGSAQIEHRPQLR